MFLTYDTSTNPMTLLMNTFQELAMNDSTYATRFACWSFAWWKKHHTKDHNIFVALWSESCLAVVALEKTAVERFWWLVYGSPAFLQMAWTSARLAWTNGYNVSCVPASFFRAYVLVPIAIVLCALYGYLHSILIQPVWDVICGFVSSVATSFYPRIWVYKMYLVWSWRFHNHAEYRFTRSELRKAATMSPTELKQKMELANIQSVWLNKFSHTEVVGLARKTIEYRTTILELLKDVNWCRKVIDSLMNYRHNEKMFQHAQQSKSGNKFKYPTYYPADILEFEEPYYSNTLIFTAEADPVSGLYYTEARRTRPLFSLKKTFTSTNKWSYYDVKHNGFKLFAHASWFTNYMHMPGCFSLFEHDPWALKANFPGIHLPEYKAHEDPIDLTNRRPVVAEPLRKWGRLIEDVAEKGRLVNWQVERLRPLEKKTVRWGQYSEVREFSTMNSESESVSQMRRVPGPRKRFS
ncbi:hypothetical protein P153DRAFT_364757 [Dothidotthia symphoricarpi CBS 119687]|uniref:Uncharacterized protein n=1 Tax=Dothidotthia symphoricarpi CBS 119687 TaxID=1392245 RepID=A0A6A6AMN3_9PLEO|nr:uncharacterized protein P153DRAFT_364757 [Dothidotthia symphoricarpi CBS 119687]KAF2132345.1 hypothetical protein P153DRAFT_364757 [Dothidotthia symphoricarpi CBS 119687]